MALECRRARPGLEQPLAAFLLDLAAAGEAERFHPHALDEKAARSVCEDDGADAYYVVVDDGLVLAYGFLRGWEAGFAVPSLGIAVHPSVRGQGIGRMLMEFLHVVARRRHAESVRLRVYPDNAAALDLYRSLGYVFAGEEDGQLVGLLELR